MTSAAADLARHLVSRPWFAPVLWFAIAFVTAAIATG
jgi:hypothetical protein